MEDIVDQDETEEVNTDTLFSQEEEDEGLEEQGSQKLLFSNNDLPSEFEDIGVDEQLDILASLGEDLPKNEAMERLRSISMQRVSSSIPQGSPDEPTVRMWLRDTEDQMSKQTEFNFNQHFSVTQAESLKNSSVSSAEARFESNLDYMNKALTDLMEDRSTVGQVADGIDYFLLRLSIGAVEDITGRDERLSKELMRMAGSTPTSELPRVFKQYVEGLKSEGILTSNNYFAISRAAEALRLKGFDPNRRGKALLAAVDLAPPLSVAMAAKAFSKVAARRAATTAVSQAGSINGSQAAGTAGNNILRHSMHPPTASAMGPKALDPTLNPTRPSVDSWQSLFVDSAVAKAVSVAHAIGSFGRAYDIDTLSGLATSIAKDYSKRISRPIHSFFYTNEGLGLGTVTIRVGTSKTGQPFTPLTQAQQALAVNKGRGAVPGHVQDQADALGGQVVPFNKDDISQGFLIELTERLDTTPLIKRSGVDADTLHTIRSAIGRYTQTSANRDLEELTTTMQQAEAGFTGLKEAILPQLKALRKLNFDSQAREALNSVYKELRDGNPDLGILPSLRRHHTKGEFKAAWKRNHRKGSDPTQRDIDAYSALVDLEKADYLLKTAELTQRLVSRGFGKSINITGHGFKPAKLVEDHGSLPAMEGILNGTKGWSQVRSGIPSTQPIWKLDKPVEVNGKVFTHVTSPKKVRVLEPGDTMGYNPGGRRYDPKASHYIVIGGGDELKTLFSAKSAKEAAKGLAELKAIQTAIRKGVSVDDTIAANNSWNPDITNLQKLTDFTTEHGFDILQDLGIKDRKDRILPSQSEVYGGLSWQDFVKLDYSRSDRVLPSYGGGTASLEDPVQSVLSQFSSSTYAFAHREYTQQAMVSWVKRMQNEDGEWLPSVKAAFNQMIPKDDYYRHFMESDTSKLGSTGFDAKQKELKNILIRRMNMEGSKSAQMTDAMEVLAQSVYDKTRALKIGKLPVGDPVGKALNIGFTSAFGFFSTAQFFMQGFHAAAIAAISPYGARSAAMAIPLRASFLATDEATVKLLNKRMAKAFGMSEADVGELVEYIRTSGRNRIEGSLIEQARVANHNVAGLGGRIGNVGSVITKGLDVGLIPFKEGERFARLTGIITAFREFKSKNPGVTALGDFGRRSITRREQDLGLNMTGASRAAVQDGLMKLPTQWMSYSMRVAEEVFVGGRLSRAERARLALVTGPMFGLTGVGVSHFFPDLPGELAEDLGYEPGGVAFITLKYGLLDGLSAWALGPEKAIGFGQRMAPIMTFLELYKDMREESISKVLAGPSGEIIAGGLVQGLNALSELAHGRPNLAVQELIKFARLPSGIDQKVKATAIIRYHTYISKSGNESGSDMGLTEALAVAFGFTPLQITELYNQSNTYYNQSKLFKQLKREVNTQALQAYRELDTGDEQSFEKFLATIEEINLKITAYGLPHQDDTALRRTALEPLTKDDRFANLIKRHLQNGTKAEQLAYASLVQGNNFEDGDSK